MDRSNDKRSRLRMRSQPFPRQPLSFGDLVGGHSFSRVVSITKDHGISSNRCNVEPQERLHIVLWHSLATGVHRRDIKLRLFISLFSQ